MENIKSTPLVSVVIPTYKRSEMLPRAIASVLNQTYKNIQVVVVDDNNPDTEWRAETSKLMEQYSNDKRILYICHEKNQNGSVARNTGMKSATGDIVCFLDDDDWFLPTKIELQVQYLLEHPEYRAVYCGWNRDDDVVVPTKEGDLSFELLSGTNLIYTNVIMMWREDAIACGGWDETFKRHQEAAFMLRFFRAGGKIGVVSQVLVEFDISDRSNAAANPQVNEEHLQHYLTSYADMIEACENNRKGAKRDIFSYRYRGVLLCYLKYKDFKGGMKVYFRMVKQMPIKFNLDFIKYCLYWVRREHAQAKKTKKAATQ